MIESVNGTLSKINSSDSTSIVKLEKTITLTGDQVLVIEPSDRGQLYDRNYTFVYGYTSSGSNWTHAGGFVTRIPNDLRTPDNPTPWSVSANAAFTVDVGYIK